MSALDSSESTDARRFILSNFGAVPRNRLVSTVRSMEKAINENRGFGYLSRLESIGEAIEASLVQNDTFKRDVEGASDGPALAELWLSGLEWVYDELVYPYPEERMVAGEESAGGWLRPSLMWAVADIGTKTEGGLALRGRRELCAKVQSAVTVYRNVMETASHKELKTTDSVTTKSEAEHDPRKLAGTVTEDTAYYRSTRRAEQLIKSCGVGTSDGDGDKYISFITTLKSALSCTPFVSEAAKMEFVFLSLRGPAQKYARQQAAKAKIYGMDSDKGYQTLLKILDDKYDNLRARRSALHEWETLRQQSSETVKQYNQRFEEAVLLQEDAGRSDLTMEMKKEKFGNGLTSVAGVAARAMVDPLTHLSFTQYVQMVCGYAQSFEACSTLPGFGKSSPAVQKPVMRTQLMTADMKDPGGGILKSMKSSGGGNLDVSGNVAHCRRCGAKNHTENSCWSNAIRDKERRCSKCGDYSHRRKDCTHKETKCVRCGRAGHAAQVCWAKMRPGTTPSHSKSETGRGSIQNTPDEGKPKEKRIDSAASIIEICNEEAIVEGRINDFVDSNALTISLRVGEKPLAEKTADCVHINALVDSGAGACFVHIRLVELLIKHGILSREDICSIRGVVVTYANGDKASCTSAVRLPIRPNADSVHDTKWLPCLISDTCQHTLVVGRPGMRVLDISVSAVDGGNFYQYSQVPRTMSVVSMVACHAVESTLLKYGSDDETIDVDYTFETVKDSTGQTRLRLKVPQIEKAGIMPYSESVRPRSYTDMRILHHRFLQMEKEEKVERVPVGEAVVQLEPVLVDKHQHAGDRPRMYPIDPDELKARYRVTLDMRPVNQMVLATDSKEFMWLPNAMASRVRTVKPTDQRQHQSSAQDILRSIPEECANFFAKIDLSEAFYAIETPNGIRRLASTRTQADDGTSVFWRFTRLVQGWTWSPIYFSRAVQYILDTIRGRLPKGVVVRHYQDDLLVCGASADAVNLALAELSSIFTSHGFHVNDKKTVFATDTIVFCGFLLSKGYYKPCPTRKDLSKEAAEAAWLEFCGFIKNRAERQAARLRSWTGRFQFLRGWLTPQLMEDLNK
ncbi:hypothetical protein Pmar_PMAR026334, partial [Perkinsus marinus ATCC 50983]